eukprot:CAMPEP_0171512576 /NCGR_PEP_ID=MMETSP0959-20130129/1673_1 /TAXON_ID=87120 /ORGANISM="Aurantiochytrium limacinum, Strain ATCCMYA-1381" /LENGTH=38 /DNA_ID= /DNA_START= /DNA_END= /DNA_ORIENTATION=
MSTILNVPDATVYLKRVRYSSSSWTRRNDFMKGALARI